MRDWSALMQFPDSKEIAAYNRVSRSRSPYLAGWLHTGSTGYTEYVVDFKADYLPRATYCCLASFDLDYGGLREQNCRNVHTHYNGVAAYAGFQRLWNGSPAAILSIWDVFYTDQAGNSRVLRPTLVYPTAETAEAFDGEGTGVHKIIPWNWSPGVWYQMLLTCGVRKKNGNTVLSMWAREPDWAGWTCLCRFDLGVPNVCMKNDMAVFLENFAPETSGDIRTMECRNARIKDKRLGWRPVEAGVFTGLASDPYAGSYGIDADKTTFCMITTGVPGKGGGSRGQTAFRVKNQETGAPY